MDQAGSLGNAARLFEFAAPEFSHLKNLESVPRTVLVRDLPEDVGLSLATMVASLYPRATVMGALDVDRSWDLRPILIDEDELTPSIIRFVGPELMLSGKSLKSFSSLLQTISSLHTTESGLLGVGNFKGQLWYRRPFALKTLAQMVRQKPVLTLEEVVLLSIAVIDRLQTWHGLGVYHGHLTLDNLCVDSGGNIILLDPGIALFTITSLISLGKPDSVSDFGAKAIAPEVFEDKADMRIDNYSLGLLISELEGAIQDQPSKEAGQKRQYLRSICQDLCADKVEARASLHEVRICLERLLGQGSSKSERPSPHVAPHSRSQSRGKSPTRSSNSKMQGHVLQISDGEISSSKPEEKHQGTEVLSPTNLDLSAEVQARNVEPDNSSVIAQVRRELRNSDLKRKQETEAAAREQKGAVAEASQTGGDINPQPLKAVGISPVQEVQPEAPHTRSYELKGRNGEQLSLSELEPVLRGVRQAGVTQRSGQGSGSGEHSFQEHIEPEPQQVSPYGWDRGELPNRGSESDRQFATDSSLELTTAKTRHFTLYGILIVLVASIVLGIAYGVYSNHYKTSSNISDLVYSRQDLQDKWASKRPSQIEAVIQSAVFAQGQTKTDAQEVVFAAALSGEAGYQGINLSMLRKLLSSRWDVELTSDDRTAAVFFAASEFLSELDNKGLKLPSSKDPHPSVLLAFAATASTKMMPFLAKIPASVFTSLSGSVGKAFSELLVSNPELSARDDDVVSLARLSLSLNSNSGELKPEQILDFLTQGVFASRMRAISSLFLDSDDSAGFLLDLVLTHPNFSVSDPLLDWAHKWQLEKRNQISSTARLKLLAGELPSGSDATVRQIVMMLDHPVDQVRAEGAKQAMNSIKFDHAGAYAVLREVSLHPERLSAQATLLLGNILDRPMAIKEADIEKWLQTEPPLSVVEQLLVGSSALDKAYPMDFYLASYLKERDWQPAPETLKTLSGHPEKFVRLLSYLLLSELEDKKFALGALESALKVEKDSRYRKRLEESISYLRSVQ